MSLTPEQKSNRRSWIGASDAAAVLGLSRWRSPLQVYLEKRGETAAQEESDQMRLGLLMEPVVLALYERERGHAVTDRGLQQASFLNDFMGCTLDGIAASEEGPRVIEAKTARSEQGWGEAGTDQIPAEYVCQAQHSLAVTGFAFCDVPVLIAGSDFRIYTVAPDAELIAAMVEREREFWRRVKVGDPPDPTTPEDMRLRFPRDNGLTITATAIVTEKLDLLRNTRDVIGRYEAQADKLTAEVQAWMGEAANLEGPDGRLVATWRQSKPSAKIDLAKLRSGFPDIAAECTYQADGARRFLLK